MAPEKLTRRPHRWRTAVLALLIALASAVAASIWVAGPASAAVMEYNTVTYRSWHMGRDICVENEGVPSAVGCFEEYGDYLDVGDTMVDHMSAGVQWKTDYNRSGICINSTGEDTYSEGGLYLGLHGCNKNFLEGHHIWIRAGRCNASKVDCHQIGNWDSSSWSGWLRYTT